jgi:cell division transport system permease protein
MTTYSTTTIKLGYLLRETWLGLRRSGWMNGAAVSTIALLLSLFGLGLLASWQMDYLLVDLGNQLEISVYLQEQANPAEMQATLAGLAGVVHTTFIPKEQAWQALLQDMGESDIDQVTALLGANPLADEIRLRVAPNAQVQAIANHIKTLAGVEAVWYTSAIAEGIRQLRLVVSLASSAVVGICIFIAVAVIHTTLRLIILFRKTEIEVLQLVGATPQWIILPFLLQGTVYGTLGSAIAYILLIVALRSLALGMDSQPELLRTLLGTLWQDGRCYTLLPVLLLCFGNGIGLGSSWLAVRRLIR